MDWSTIVEFFTKRGRPLSKDDISKLIDEDRKQREADEFKVRAEEEAENRRNQRIMGDIEEDEDFEAFEERQKAEALDEEEEDERRGLDEEDYDPEDLSREDEEDFDENRTTGGSELGESLAKTKLTQQDYVKRTQSAKVKKGKYGVTVPQPFGFDIRDKSKSKSIT